MTYDTWKRIKIRAKEVILKNEIEEARHRRFLRELNENNVFGTLLREFRVDHVPRITLIDAARHIEVTVPYLSNIERNSKYKLSRRKLQQLFDLLGLSQREQVLMFAYAERAGVCRPEHTTVHQFPVGTQVKK